MADEDPKRRKERKSGSVMGGQEKAGQVDPEAGAGDCLRFPEVWKRSRQNGKAPGLPQAQGGGGSLSKNVKKSLTGEKRLWYIHSGNCRRQ